MTREIFLLATDDPFTAWDPNSIVCSSANRPDRYLLVPLDGPFFSDLEKHSVALANKAIQDMIDNARREPG
jgi:hypothetical protein